MIILDPSLVCLDHLTLSQILSERKAWMSRTCYKHLEDCAQLPKGQGIIPSMGTVTEYLEPLCSYGPPHAALMMYKKTRKGGCRISFTAYKLLLMRLSRFGKCGMLLNIWDEMQESGYTSDMQVYEHIINGLCNTGQLETAVLVMNESLCQGFFPSKIICSKLNNKLMDSNKVEIAYKLSLKLRNARNQENAQRYWRAKGWHF